MKDVIIFLLFAKCFILTFSPVQTVELAGTCKANSDCTVLNSECSGSVCACATGYKETSGNCSQVLDGSCSVDSDCSSALSNTRCCNGTCLCSSGYKPDSLECSTVYQISCGSSPDCNTYMANTRCDFHLFLCLCSKDYTYNETTLTCDDDTGSGSTTTVSYSSSCSNDATTAPSDDVTDTTATSSNDAGTTVGYGGQCTSTSDCVSHSSCTSGTCSCNAGYKTNGTMCQKIIGGPCVYTIQCTYYEPNSNCIIGYCSCLDGFYETDVFCSRGVQARAPGVLAVFVHILLVAMVTRTTII